MNFWLLFFLAIFVEFLFYFIETTPFVITLQSPIPGLHLCIPFSQSGKRGFFYVSLSLMLSPKQVLSIF